MKLAVLLVNILILIILTACSDKASILANQIKKSPAHLKIMNSNGFIGSTVAGSSFEHTLILKNKGGLPVSNLSATITTTDPISFSGGSYPGTGGTCTDDLISGQTCTIILNYEPQNTSSHVATLNFTYSDPISNYTLDYVVSADSNPILEYKYGKFYDFGNRFVGTTTRLVIELSNVGKVTAQNISINDLSLPFILISNTCGSALTPGQSCELTVDYSPTASGKHDQDITLTYLNTGRTEESTLSLQAWGFYKAGLTLTSNSGFDFGTVANGNNGAEKIITITHDSGDVTATSLNLSLSSPFVKSGGSCGTTLTKETGSCYYIIKTNSSSSGTWSGTLTFTYNNGQTTETITKTITAITKEKPVLSISPIGTVDFGVANLNVPKTKTFTITYDSGELPATLNGFSSLASPYSISGGSCAGTLSSGSCTVEVSYTPTTWTTSSTLATKYSYSNTVDNEELSATTFLGKSINELYPNGGNALGNVVSGETKISNVTIRSRAGALITSLTSEISGSSPFSIVSGGTCSSTINPSSSCTIKVSFSSTIPGLNTENLVVNYFNGIEIKTLTVSLSANVTPRADISIADYDFGTQSVNSFFEKTITVTNTSNKAGVYISHTLPAGFSLKNGSFSGTGGSCTTSDIFNNCTLKIIFNPTQAISYSGTFTLNYDDGTGTTRSATATFSGQGENTTDLFLSDFDTYNMTPTTTYIGQTRTKVFTLYQGGSSTSTTIDSKTFTSSDFSISNDTCPSSLSNGDSCLVTVQFAPTVSGTQNTSLKVDYANSTKSVSRLLQGSAQIPAILSISPNNGSFGNVGTDENNEKIFTITNTGSNTATSVSIPSLTSPFSIQSNNCPTSLGASGTCTITVKFSPSMSGPAVGLLKVDYYNKFTNKTTQIDLTGTGVDVAKLSLSSSYDFGKVIQTQTSSRTITVTNTGTGSVSATNITLGTLSAPFSRTGGTCTDTLAQGADCTIVIEFAPTSAGVRNQTLSISYSNGSKTATQTSTLNGEGITQAILTLSETNPYNMGTTNINNTISKTFILTNSGGYIGENIVKSFSDSAFEVSGGTCGTSLAALSTCNLIVSFTPTAAQTYSGTLTLTYEDGLRPQTETKNLTGTGSSKMASSMYLSMFHEQDFYSLKTNNYVIDDLNLNQTTDQIYTTQKIIRAYDEIFEQIIFQMPQLLPQGYIEGLRGFKLDEDKNGDGVDDVLFSVHKSEGDFNNLVGYSIRCALTGNIIELFNKDTPTQVP